MLSHSRKKRLCEILFIYQILILVCADLLFCIFAVRGFIDSLKQKSDDFCFFILKAGFELFSVITRCNALISFKQAVKIAQIIKAAGKGNIGY